MAIRKLGETVAEVNWSSKMPLPKDRYTIRCTDEKFGMNSNNNPMITREWEIVAPEVVMCGDQNVTVTGVKVQQYAVCKVKADDGTWDAKKSDSAYARLRDDLLLLGFDGEEIDDENPPLVAKGKVVEAILYGRKSESRKDATPEQRAKGAKVGDPITGLDGKPVVVYQPQIDSILGLSNAEVGSQY
jgi:hypothetical protein